MLSSVTIRVPATTANLGPGFDCLGLALDLWDEVTLRPIQAGAPAPHPNTEDHQYQELVRLAAERFYAETGTTQAELEIGCKRAIPLGRGLGSSAAAIVAGVLGANALAGRPLDHEAVGRLAAAIEGHPDNSTPCLFGGFQVCVLDGHGVLHQAVPVPEGLGCVLFVPDFALPTHETRKLLPKELSRADVVYQTSRAALLVAALTSGNLAHLHEATQDRLHQPARGQVFTGMWALFEAAMSAGALCVYLSGGGPTVLALSKGDTTRLERVLGEAARNHGIAGRTLVTRPSDLGAYVVTS